MPTSGKAHMFRYLTAGTLVDVPERGGKAEIIKCSWLVRVPSGHPEPDFPEDCWTEVECGARVREHPSYRGRFEPGEATICDNGHDRLPLEIAWAPFGPNWEAEERERLAEERGEDRASGASMSHGERAAMERAYEMGIDG